MCNNDNNFTGVSSSSIKAKSIISMDSHIKNPTIKDELIQTVIFKEKPIYQKWRSVEENVAILFGSMENVVKVTDVSKSNLGYDLEIQWKDDITYLEIKSVGKLGDSFSLTNNEYATAVEYAGKYVLAIVEQSTELLTMCLVYEPIVNLDLFKRVTRWEWVCNEYSGKVVSSKIN
ncbi:protein NO VEIN domain-containing protein [Acetobacterium sp.]|uniref:protein NO VEIN domain-containing protein n=1 Tax=Acetobacterium sp. TaxID=1872094 RepID=UPI00359376B9